MIFSSSAGRFCQGHQVDQSLWLGGSADMLMQPWVNSRHGLQVVMRLWLTELFVVTPRGQVCNAFLVMHEVTSGTHWWNSDGKRVTSASSGQLKNYHVSGFDRPQRDGGYIRFGTLRRVSSVLMRVLMSSACSCAVRPALRWHLIHEKHASQRFVDFLDFSGWSNFQTYTMSCHSIYSTIFWSYLRWWSQFGISETCRNPWLSTRWVHLDTENKGPDTITGLML